MTSSPYVLTNNPVLRNISQVIPPKNITSNDIQKIINLMLEVGMKDLNMAGLAAPQIGFPFKIIIVNDNALVTDRPDPDKIKEKSFKVFVNPEIIAASREEDYDVEGCFSVPGHMGIVSRAKSITVSAYDRKGNKIHMSLTGFAARVLQHEVDHINGLIYPDRIFQFHPESKMFHFLNDVSDTPEHQQERSKEYREAIKGWKTKHGNLDEFTWPDTISKECWEHDMIQSKPDWKSDPLPPSVKE